MNEYFRKIELVKSIIQSHNDSFEDPKDKLDCDLILLNLKKSGGTSEEALQAASWEDLEDCGIPKILARRIAHNVFRSVVRQDGLAKPPKRANVAEMTIEDLFKNYNPDNSESFISKRLKIEAGDQKVVAFNSDGTVNALESSKQLRLYKNGFMNSSRMVGYTIIDNTPCQLYAIGQKQAICYDVNPLFPNDVLFEDMCLTTHRTWSGIPHTIKQLIYLAVTRTAELKVSSIEDAHKVHDLLGQLLNQAPNIYDRLFPTEIGTIRFPKAAILLSELKRINEEPSLKVSKDNKVNRTNDPFYKHSQT